MRWHDPLDRIPGLGPRRAEFLREQGFRTVGDLLLHAPLRLIDRRKSPPFDALSPPPVSEITAVGAVESVGERIKGGKRRLICHITDGSGHLQGVWFNNYSYLKPKLIPGSRVAFTGKVTLFDGPQIVHPKVDFLENPQTANRSADDSTTHPKSTTRIPSEGLIPIYPSGEEWEKLGLSRHALPRILHKLADDWDGGGPFVPDEVRIQLNMPSLREAVKGLHAPQTWDDFDRGLHALKFAELFHHQLLMVALRRRRRQREGMAFAIGGIKFTHLIEALPFELSKGQGEVLMDIEIDFASGYPMYRLLQGEVGAGKTVVALLAAAVAADNNRQTAIMAPTELLARQHYATAVKWCEPAGIKVSMVASSRSRDENRRALFEAETGGAGILIGTHALFQERVTLKRLGLAVIDEQQRFGVRQRALLVGKGIHPHVLMMTATPIPRTLALAHYGDIDLSFLPPLPAMKRQVRTRVVSDARRDRVFDWLRQQLAAGKRGYLIFPVIDEGPAGLEAAQSRFEPYRKIDFKGIPIALLHGRQPVEERIRAMEAFRRGDVKLLMATAVVEVGVDVPEASLMVIENAERFGLAQLHQLRGRIGRDGNPAVCVLMTPELPGQQGFERLKRLEFSHDGAALAEVDLKMRGGGEPLGARQVGAVKFRLADLAQDLEILKRAHAAAENLLDKYPDLAPFPELREKLRSDYRARPRTIRAG